MADRTHRRVTDRSGRTSGFVPDKEKRDKAEAKAAVQERMEGTDLGAAGRRAQGKKEPEAAGKPEKPDTSGMSLGDAAAKMKEYRKALREWSALQETAAVKGQKKALREMK